jgi:hypothetical protein
LIFHFASDNKRLDLTGRDRVNSLTARSSAAGLARIINMQHTRPNWLKYVIGTLFAWIILMASLFLLALPVALLNEKHVLPESSFIALGHVLAIGVLSIVATFYLTKWQNSVLREKSLKTNYLVLVILVLLVLFVIPIPFTYTMF